MDHTTLMEIGLTEGEAKVYLAMNKIGSSTVGPIVDESKVSRSKIYDILERLINKGLASFIVKDKTKYFQANDPSKINEYLELKEKEIEKNKKKLEELVPFLLQQKNLGKEESSVQVYEGFKGVTAAHEHLYSRLKKGDKFYYLGIPAFQEEKYHAYWNKDHRKRIRHGLTCRLIFDKKTPKETLINRNSFKGSDARYNPLDIETPAWIMGYNNVTLIGLQSKKGMAIEIINQEIADSFRNYFEALWKMSKPFKS